MRDQSERLARLLRSPCGWPDCFCGERLNHWIATLDEWKTQPCPTLQDWDLALVEVHIINSCIEANCPDKQAQRRASVVLIHPIFDKVPEAQRRLETDAYDPEPEADTSPERFFSAAPEMPRTFLGTESAEAQERREAEIAERRSGIRNVKKGH